MVEQEQLNIIKLFSDKPDVELTIHQISKTIKKSYAFTNKYTHELINDGILRKKLIGNAIVCSLSLDSEQAIGLLILNSINKKVSFEKMLKPEQKIALAEYIKSIDADVETVFIDTNSSPCIKIVSRSNILSLSSEKKISGFKVSIISIEQFRKDLQSMELSKIIVVKNHELFWNNILSRRGGYRY